MKKLFPYSILFVLFIFSATASGSLGQSSHGSGYLTYAWQGVQDHPVVAGSPVIGTLILAKLIHSYTADSTTMPRVFIHNEPAQMSPWARTICLMTAEQLQSLSDAQFDAIIDHNDLEQVSTKALGRIIDEQTWRAQAIGLL